ncbi:hypothetical protein [Enterovirga rhinocerotis]|nr:hypothetical protein [Enterovirga rhinocerotis]
MTRLLILPFTLAAAAPAWAEVCDKVAGDGWRREHGPVSWTPPAAGNWASVEAWKLVALVLVLTVLAAMRFPHFRWIAALVLSVAAAHSLLLWGLYASDGNDVIAAAIREGCLPASSLAHIGTGPSLGLPLAWAMAAGAAWVSHGLRHAS